VPTTWRGYELVHESVSVGGRTLVIERPHDAEELLDEEPFEREEFLPYWAELWPSALALADHVASRDLAGLGLVELGCGLALPGIVAALGGAAVLATDWSEDALEFVRANARRNGAEVETLRCSWTSPDPLVARAPFDLVLASDVLYERRDVEPLLALLPRLAPEVLLADPGRPTLSDFLERAAEAWLVERSEPVYRLVGAPHEAG